MTIKKGALHRQLEIDADVNIPVTLMRKIKSAPIGSRIKNPTLIGKRYVTVTPLLKKRVVFALNFRG